MTTRALIARRRLMAPIALVAFALVAAACGGGSTEATATSEAPGSAVAAVGTDAPVDNGTGASDASSYDFPTGEPVLVPVGYEHPRDRVDNTGAYLPTNGKPTLVFVDAIW